MSGKITRQMRVQARTGIVTKEELQERWTHLELKPGTLLHLQELLDTTGIGAAVLVTEAIAHEKKAQVTYTNVGKEWGTEVLRLVSLESLRPHLVEMLRVVLEAVLAWHLISLPDATIDDVVEMTLAALFLILICMVISLMCHLRRKRSASTKQ